MLPILLVTAGIFAAHYHEIPPNFDLLHNGNMTLPAQQFLQFGNIPLLDIWEHQNLPILPFLYGVLNGLNLLEQLPPFTFIVIGIQMISTSFLADIIRIKRKGNVNG